MKPCKPARIKGKLEIFSYLDGDVIHYKVVVEGRGALQASGEDMLLAPRRRPAQAVARGAASARSNMQVSTESRLKKTEERT